jgi:hypothetical protein
MLTTRFTENASKQLRRLFLTHRRHKHSVAVLTAGED